MKQVRPETIESVKEQRYAYHCQGITTLRKVESIAESERTGQEQKGQHGQFTGAFRQQEQCGSPNQQ